MIYLNEAKFNYFYRTILHVTAHNITNNAICTLVKVVPKNIEISIVAIVKPEKDLNSLTRK